MRSNAVGIVRKGKASVSLFPVEAKEVLSPKIFFVLAAVFVVGVFALYSPALNFQFILDDHRFVGDPRIQSAGHLWEYFTNYVWAQIPGAPASFYRPLFIVWVRLNFIFSGMSPWGWHFLSVAKHLAAAILLGVLAWKLLKNRTVALIAGTLFVLHPAQTESVAWATVPDPLTASAILGTILFYLVYVDQRFAFKPSRNPRKKIRDTSASDSIKWLIAAAATCLVALFTKETAIILPVLLFAFIFVFLPNAGKKLEAIGLSARLLSAVRESIPFIGVTVIYLLLRLYALGGTLGGITQHLAWKTIVLSWPATLWFYVKVLFWPVQSRAFANPDLVKTFSFREVVLPLLGVCCAAAILTAGFVWAWRKASDSLLTSETKRLHQGLVLGALLFLLPFPLTLNLNALEPGDFLHGRYMYLSLCGLMLLLATWWHLAGKAQMPLLGALACIAIAFSILTVKQEGMWKDDLTVFTTAHELAPNNAPIAQDLARAHVQVALGLADEDRCDEAIPIFNQATEQYPQDWFAWAGRGECLFKLNDLQGSEQSLHHAYELSKEPRIREEWQMVRQKMGDTTLVR